MCNPAAAVQAAATVVSIGQQIANSSAMKAYGQRTYDANKKIAEADALQSYAALQARQLQEGAKAAEAINSAALESQRRMAAARTVAGESGAAGVSVQDVLGEFKTVELNYQTTVIRNKAMLDAQFKSELEATRAQEQGRILSGLPGPSQSPDILGTALSGFGKILEINASEKANQPNEVLH